MILRKNFNMEDSIESIKSEKNVVTLSHNDLDGIYCTLLINQCYKIINTPIFTSYRKLKENFNLLYDYVCEQRPQLVFITDLHINEPHLIELVNEISKIVEHIIIIDHHVDISDELNNISNIGASNIHYYFNVNKCATKITYEVLSKSFNLDKWKETVNYTNAFDIWKQNEEPHNFSQGLIMSDIVWATKNPNKFFTHWKNKPFDFNEPNIKIAIKNNISKQEIYLDKLKKNKLMMSVGNKFLITYADDYLHHIKLKYNNYDNYINVTSYNNISFVVNTNNQENLISTFKDYIKSTGLNILSMGGHEKILSVQMEESTNTIMNMLKDYVDLVQG